MGPIPMFADVVRKEDKDNTQGKGQTGDAKLTKQPPARQKVSPQKKPNLLICRL